MPLAAYLNHLRVTREQYGERVARLDLSFAIELREKKIQAASEAGKRTNGDT
jgi:hypothetical protein